MTPQYLMEVKVPNKDLVGLLVNEPIPLLGFRPRPHAQGATRPRGGNLGIPTMSCSILERRPLIVDKRQWNIDGERVNTRRGSCGKMQTDLIDQPSRVGVAGTHAHGCQCQPSVLPPICQQMKRSELPSVRSLIRIPLRPQSPKVSTQLYRGVHGLTAVLRAQTRQCLTYRDRM